MITGTHTQTRERENMTTREKKNKKGGKLEIFLRMQGGCVFSVYGCTLDSVVYTINFRLSHAMFSFFAVIVPYLFIEFSKRCNGTPIKSNAYSIALR